jgi:hypothetical protein
MVLVANTLPPMLVKRSERPNIVTNRMKESLRFFVVCKLFKTGRKIKQELVEFCVISVQDPGGSAEGGEDFENKLVYFFSLIKNILPRSIYKKCKV